MEAGRSEGEARLELQQAGAQLAAEPTLRTSPSSTTDSIPRFEEEVDYENAFIGPFGKKRRILFEQMQRIALHGYVKPSTTPEKSAEERKVLTTEKIWRPSPLMGDSSSAKRGAKNYRCEECNKEFTQRRNYEYHKSKHDGTMQFAGTCPICSKTFSNKDYLSSHMKIHCNSREYKCDWCTKSFNQRTAYNMHIRIHTGYKPHVCQICTKAFSRKGILRLHMRTHTDKRIFTCKTCQKSFTNEANLKKHESIHGTYVCEVCSKTFVKNHLLKTHMKEHANVGAHRCPQCGASFHIPNRLKIHIRKCTQSAAATASSTEGEAPAPGPSGSSSGAQQIARPSSANAPSPRLPPRMIPPPFSTIRMPLFPPSRPSVIRSLGTPGSRAPMMPPPTLQYPYFGIMRLPHQVPPPAEAAPQQPSTSSEEKSTDGTHDEEHKPG